MTPEADPLVRADLRERLAALCHEQWAGWMRYLFSRCLPDGNGACVIPDDWRERWRRQMNTLYADLPEAEKNSDRAEADRVLALTGEEVRRLTDALRKKEDELRAERRLRAEDAASHLDTEQEVRDLRARKGSL